MHRNKSVSVHQFAMVPKAEIPRSRFRMQHTHKTTFDAGYLVPIYCEEVLPGDTFNMRMTAFARLATPLFPIMDNLHLDTFFFFVPNRLVWDNWQKFMGEQRQPGDSTDYLVPQVVSPVGGFAVGSIYDYFGCPTVGQVDVGADVSVSALPFRGYSLIYNEWFRDQNLQASFDTYGGDGPESDASYGLVRRGKRHDYFTSCLPWPQKGESVSVPLGTTAPIIPASLGAYPTFTAEGSARGLYAVAGSNNVGLGGATLAADVTNPAWAATGLVADLATATAATVNQLRQSFQIQKLLERDARGGTRYTEILRAHFGVVSPDARLQRPEYLGGGTTSISISPIAQTSGTAGPDGYTDTPQGNLAAVGTAVARNHGFHQSFTEHGYIIGLASVRADLTYQQGLRRHWSRRTRYDYYFPAFAALGEQAVLRKEIYCTGDPANDDAVFGYQERWAEYRYGCSQITGLFKSTTAGTIDAWHLAQRFTSAPTLSSVFIAETPPLDRITAVGAAAYGQHLLCDMFFDCTAVRAMPMYSVPGLIDHF